MTEILQHKDFWIQHNNHGIEMAQIGQQLVGLVGWTS